jgi:uncharacterized protein YwqG
VSQGFVRPWWRDKPLRFLAQIALERAGGGELPEFEYSEPMERERTEEGDDAYWEVRESLASGQDDGAAHKLPGHPNTNQAPMQTECQLASHGNNYRDCEKHDKRRAEELARGAKDWRLLCRLDTDDHAERTWGDTGALYFWIREQDLSERRFDKVWTVLQCH